MTLSSAHFSMRFKLNNLVLLLLVMAVYGRFPNQMQAFATPFLHLSYHHSTPTALLTTENIETAENYGNVTADDAVLKENDFESTTLAEFLNNQTEIADGVTEATLMRDEK